MGKSSVSVASPAPPASPLLSATPDPIENVSGPAPPERPPNRVNGIPFSVPASSAVTFHTFVAVRSGATSVSPPPPPSTLTSAPAGRKVKVSARLPPVTLSIFVNATTFIPFDVALPWPTPLIVHSMSATFGPTSDSAPVPPAM